MASKKALWNSDSESSTESDSDREVVVPQQKSKKKILKPQIFTDESEDEEKRIVKSVTDKRFDELKEIIKKAKNARKNKDFNSSLNMFQELTRSFSKSAKVIEKEGIPTFYIKELVELDDYIKSTWEDKDFKKKLSKDRSRGLTTIRQRIRKYFNEEDCKDIVKKMDGYRLNPEASEEEIEQPSGAEEEPKSEQDSMSSDDAESDDEDKHGKWAGSESSDDSYSDSDSSSSESDQDQGLPQDPDNEFSRYTISYFIRKPDDGKEERPKKVDKPKRKQKDQKEFKDKESNWKVVDKKPANDVDEHGNVVLFPKDVVITAKNVIQKLAEINTMGRRKETDRKNKVTFLVRLRELVIENELGMGLDMKVRLSIISALYEYNPKHKDYMSDEAFKQVIGVTQGLVDCLMANRGTMVMHEEIQDDVDQDEEKEQDEPEKKHDVESVSDKPNADGKWYVRGSLVNTCMKLDTEFFKLLQNSDQHSEEYRGRLRSNALVVKILKTGVEWADDQDDQQQRCQMYLLVVKYVYYRHSSQCEGVANAETLMDKYCKFIYTHDETQRIRTQAILYNIYHLALHDKWFQARDLMLMSHLQESIHNADIGTQIIYNRTMVQLGLCAFRKGQMEDAHQALTDIQSGNRARELLAQGFSMPRERTQDQERTERRRMQPYHTHINTELLECVYLVSAMFLEIPYMAEKEFDHRRRMISKQFHYQLRNSEKQAFVGPPDNMREHVLAAAKSLKVGDWKKCIDYLINPKMNQKVWNLFAQTEKVKDMLRAYAKKESLRVYLFSYSQFYDNISSDWIMDNFDMSFSSVHSEVSKMIINEELKASWDEPTNSLVLHQTEPTRLQNLALQLSQRLNQLTETNERLCESKQGSNFTAFYASTNYKSKSRDFTGNNNRSNHNRTGFTGYRAGNRNNFQPQRSGNWNRNSHSDRGGHGGGHHGGGRGGHRF